MSAPIEKMPPKPPVYFTVERKEQFLAHLRRTGLRYRSAELTGVSYYTVNDHRNKDAEFRRLFEEAEQAYIDDVLVAAAEERAVRGVQKPIIGGKFKDEVVAHEQVYSDSLLTLLLKSRRKEYKEGVDANAAGAAEAKASFAVPGAPMSQEEWKARYRDVAKGKTQP